MKEYTSSYHATRGLFWLRVLDFGFRVKDVRQHPLLFSERELGHGWRMGNYHFRFLKP